MEGEASRYVSRLRHRERQINITSSCAAPGSARQTPRRAGTSIVAFAVRSCQPPHEARCDVAGLLDSFPAQSRKRKPSVLTLRWWSGADGWPAWGEREAESSRACSPTAECQTDVVCGVRSARFRSAAHESWPCSRLLLALGRTKSRGLMLESCPCEASRAIAASPATCGASRRNAAGLAVAKPRGLLCPSGSARSLCLSRQFAAVGTSESIQRSRRS